MVSKFYIRVVILVSTSGAALHEWVFLYISCNGFNEPSKSLGAMAMAGLEAARPKCLAIALPNAVDIVLRPLLKGLPSGCSKGTIGSMTMPVIGNVRYVGMTTRTWKRTLKP